MKKVRTILFGLAVLSMAACTQEKIDAPANDNQNLVDVTIEAGIDNGVDSRVVFGEPEGDKVKMNWNESGESFTLQIGNTARVAMIQSSAPSDNKATFTGKLPSNQYTNNTFGIYPSNEKVSINSSTQYDFSKQTGDYDDSHTHMYAYLGPYKNWDKASLTFKPIVSVLKVNLSFEGVSGTASAVTFSSPDLYNKAYFRYDNTEANMVWQTMTATNTVRPTLGNIVISENITVTEGKATVILYMLPWKVTDLKVSAMVDGKEYNGTVNNYTGNEGKGFKAGVLYSTSVDMSTEDAGTPDVTVSEYAVAAVTGGYSYEGLDMTITNVTKNYTKTVSFDATGNAVIGSEAWANFAAGDKISVCIPKVVKFFHTVTAADVAAKTFVLPDKNNGSTLIADSYVNDWIVALYMGVDSADGKPLYWATGNLIGAKTNAAGEATVASFYIATTEDTAAEATAANPFRISSASGLLDTYINMDKGTRWDMFQAYPTGLSSATGNEGVLQKDKGIWESETSGSAKGNIAATDHDVCRVQLGGEWRLPTNVNSAGDAGTRYSISGELFDLLGGNPLQSNVSKKGLMYTVTYTAAGSIVNTLNLPQAGMIVGQNNDRNTRAVYMSGTLGPATNLMFTWDDNNWGCNNSTNYMFAVRPVTE